MTNNRFVFVDREVVDGVIEGVDFGPKAYCVARSPRAVLLWIYGHSWSVNGFQRYAEPHFVGLPDRSGRHDVSKTYKRIGRDGGRLSCDRAFEVGAQLIELFDDTGAAGRVGDAVRLRKTLLIEGGGAPLRPARLLGREAYLAWAALPARGFVAKDVG